MSTVDQRCGTNRAMRALCKSGLIGLAVVALLALATSVSVQASNLVVNGGFEVTTNGPNFSFDTLTQAPPWANPGDAAVIYAPGASDTVGAQSPGGNIKLWGPGTGSNNGLTATSPAGGNYVAAEGDPTMSTQISQLINGLNPGSTYFVSFWWAGAQQAGFVGDHEEFWIVGFGGQSQSGRTVFVPSEGFSGWMYQSLTFIADNTSDDLTFLAEGGAGGSPYLLLDGVSVNALPEPGSLTLIATGLIGAAGYARRRVRR